LLDCPTPSGLSSRCGWHQSISLYIADSLRPLRDFFLVLFFFSLGAGFDLGMLGAVFLPTLLLGTLLMGSSLVFRSFLQWAGERASIAMEVGCDWARSASFHC